VVTLPAEVADDDAAYRPEVLFWIGGDGALVGSTMADPGELLPLACESLRSAMRRPMAGDPRRPARVRVASPALAAVLREGHPTLEVVCAPTPEIDEVLAQMAQHIAEQSAPAQSYLSPGLTADGLKPEHAAAFFEATAALFEAKPWELVPPESQIAVDVQRLGLRGAVLSVMGQLDQDCGFILFASGEDFEAYLAAASAFAAGDKPQIPAYFALSFERGADLSPELRQEIAQQRWRVAGAEAFPWLVTTGVDLAAHPATAKDVTLAEAIARALTQLRVEAPALLAAEQRGEALRRTLSVATHQGELEVTLCVPPPPRIKASAARKLFRKDK